jgi:hypothetical protein
MEQSKRVSVPYIQQYVEGRDISKRAVNFYCKEDNKE